MSYPGYIRFQLRHALYPLLNVGVSANPAGFEGEGVYHLDLDRWKYDRFVQADAHFLPFKNDSFASAVCGDVFEHLVDPTQALGEMRRVAPRVVLTVFEEWRLPGEGQHIAVGHALFPDQGHREGDILEFYPEERLSHGPHINQFSLEALLDIFARCGLNVSRQETDCPGIHEGHPMKNWMFVLERS